MHLSIWPCSKKAPIDHTPSRDFINMTLHNKNTPCGARLGDLSMGLREILQCLGKAHFREPSTAYTIKNLLKHYALFENENEALALS